MTYSPDDYDAKGQLRLPLSFWVILLLQARTWLLFAMAGASRQQGNALLTLFYPDRQAFWLGMALGLPAMLGLLLTGYRQRAPRLWQAWRWVLMATLLLTFVCQSVTVFVSEAEVPPLFWFTALLDWLALLTLGFSARLRDCFHPDKNH